MNERITDKAAAVKIQPAFKSSSANSTRLKHKCSVDLHSERRGSGTLQEGVIQPRPNSNGSRLSDSQLSKGPDMVQARKIPLFAN